VTLGGKIVDFIWADVVYKVRDLFGIGKVTVMEEESRFGKMGILVNMVYTGAVK